MKKILWLIFLSALSVPVLAKETFYSKYTPYSEFTDKYIEETDTVSVKEENRYKWYKEELNSGEYRLYNKNDNFSNDCYLKDLSRWSYEKIDNPGYVYQSRDKYKYILSRGARYIHLYDLQGSYGSFRLTEFNVKVKNQNIDYTYECNGCWGNFKDYINNGKYAENESYIKNNGSITFDLKKEYPLYLLDTIFYIFDLGDSDKKFTMGFSNDKRNIFLVKNYNMKFKDDLWKDAKKINVLVNEDTFAPGSFSYGYTSNELIDTDFVIKRDAVKEYAYQEKWCRANNVNRIYTDYTNENIEGYKRDLKTKKVFYSFKTRDKLELDIKDITKKMDLKDFIVSATDEVKIEDDIDWNTNGTYKIKFILNDLEVNKKVNLNLEENSIRVLEEKIKELNNKILELNNSLKDKDKLIDTNNSKYKEDIKKLNDIIKLRDSLLKEKENEYKTNINQIQDNYLKELDKLKTENDKISYNNNTCKYNNEQLNKKIINLENINKNILNTNKQNMNINKTYKEKIKELENSLFNLNNGANKKIKEQASIIENNNKKINELEKEETSQNKFLLKINDIKAYCLLFGLLFFLIFLVVLFKKKK